MKILLGIARVYFSLDKVFKADYVCFRSFLRSLFLGLEDETRGERMSILALLTIGAFPEPTKPARMSLAGRRSV